VLKLLAILCFIAAAFLLWQRYQPLSFSSGPQAESLAGNDPPISISVPSLNLHLLVFPGEIKNNHWPVTSKGVIYLSSSPPSNTIIYGHNWPNILGRLKNVRVGQEIKLTYAGNQTRKFIVLEVKVVGPNETEILKVSATDQLTVYTCTGFLDSKRLVVVAKPG